MDYPGLSRLNELSDAAALFFLNNMIKWVLFLSVIFLLTRLLGKHGRHLKHLLYFISIISAILIPAGSYAVRNHFIGDSISGMNYFNQSNLLYEIQKINRGIIDLSDNAGYDMNDYVQSYDESVKPSSIFILVWLSGLFVCLSYRITVYIYFRIGFFKSKKIRTEDLFNLKETARIRLNMKKDADIFFTDVFNVPFACNIMNPVIVIPASLRDAPDNELYPVILHELAHIKRHDGFTQTVSETVCSIFWFVPLLRIIFARQKIEQEKSCDAYVIANGVEPSVYALQLVNMSKTIFGFATASLTGMSGRHKSGLEMRVISLLGMKEQDTRKMRPASIPLTVLILMVMYLFSSYFNFVNFSDNKFIYENKMKAKFNRIYDLKLPQIPVESRKFFFDTPFLWPVECYYYKNDAYYLKTKKIWNIYSYKKSAGVFSSASGFVEKTETYEDGTGSIVLLHKNGIKSTYSGITMNKNFKESNYLNIGSFLGFMAKTGCDEDYYFTFSILHNNKQVDPFPFMFRLGRQVYNGP